MAVGVKATNLPYLAYLAYIDAAAAPSRHRALTLTAAALATDIAVGRWPLTVGVALSVGRSPTLALT